MHRIVQDPTWYTQLPYTKTTTETTSISWSFLNIIICKCKTRLPCYAPAPRTKYRNYRPSLVYVKRVKKRKLDLYSAPLWEARLWSAQVWIAQFLGCKVHHTCLYLVKNSPDGATTNSDCSLLNTIDYKLQLIQHKIIKAVYVHVFERHAYKVNLVNLLIRVFAKNKQSVIL